MGLVGLALLQGQLAAEMFGVATEGRRAEAIVGGQGAQRHAVEEAAVDLREGGVVTDGTAPRLESLCHRNVSP